MRIFFALTFSLLTVSCSSFNSRPDQDQIHYQASRQMDDRSLKNGFFDRHQ